MTYYRRGEHKPIRTGRAARTRVGTFNSPARRTANLTKVADRVNAGKVTTADYLTGTLHAPAEFAASYASPYGRTVAKVYRAEYGTEPQRCGLAVRGRKLLPVFAYSATDTAILEKAAGEYRRTAELVAHSTEAHAAPAETEQQPAEVTTDSLAAELAERHALPAALVAQRVQEIAAGMRSNPVLSAPRNGALTERGASVVRALVAAEAAEGILQSEAPAGLAPGDRVSLYVSDSADRVTGTVHAIERNAIGQGVAEILLPGGQATHQAVRFLTAA